MVSQLLVNSAISGSLFALVGVGFCLTFGVVRFFHFTHGLYYAGGAYLTLLFKWAGMPTVVAGGCAVLVVSLVALVIDLMTARPLWIRRASAIVSLLASMGVYIIGQNILSIGFGDAVHRSAPVVFTSALKLLVGEPPAPRF